MKTLMNAEGPASAAAEAVRSGGREVGLDLRERPRCRVPEEEALGQGCRTERSVQSAGRRLREHQLHRAVAGCVGRLDLEQVDPADAGDDAADAGPAPLSPWCSRAWGSSSRRRPGARQPRAVRWHRLRLPGLSGSGAWRYLLRGLWYRAASRTCPPLRRFARSWMHLCWIRLGTAASGSGGPRVEGVSSDERLSRGDWGAVVTVALAVVDSVGGRLRPRSPRVEGVSAATDYEVGARFRDGDSDALAEAYRRWGRWSTRSRSARCVPEPMPRT